MENVGRTFEEEPFCWVPGGVSDPKLTIVSFRNGSFISALSPYMNKYHFFSSLIVLERLKRKELCYLNH